MAEDRGFWQERPRRGQDDARILAAEQLHALRQLPFGALAERAGRDPEVQDVAGTSGERFRRRTRITRFGEDLRVVIQVDGGGARGRLDPLAEEVVTATPDGDFLRDTTLAALSDDSRRYSPLSPTVIAVAAVVLIALIAAFVLLAPD